jgi:hypothetical protein
MPAAINQNPKQKLADIFQDSASWNYLPGPTEICPNENI